MRSFHLDPLLSEEEATVRALERRHPTPRVRRRATIVLISHRGFHQSGIATALGVSRPFVHKTLMRYQKQGFVGLLEQHPGRACKLTPAQIEQMIHWVEQGPKAYHYAFAQWDTRTLQWRILQVYNLQLSREAIRQVLHRHEFRWKRPTSTYSYVDPEARARTKEEVEGLHQQATAGEIILLLQDEAIATLVTTLQCGWSRKGVQLKIPSTGKHGKEHRCTVFGVVNPVTGDVHYRIFDAINKQNMASFLRHLARFYHDSPLPIWMVMDNHGAHKNQEAAFHAAGIHPYYMAPACGDLNRIEYLWAWMRERNLHSIFFQTLQELKAAIREFFCYIAGRKQLVLNRVA